MAEEQITTLEELKAAADAGKNVRIPTALGCERLMDLVGTPARTVIHSKGDILLRWFREGMFVVDQ